jgi:hypothetical protein
MPATAELSPAAANRQCPRLPSPVPGEHAPADRSRQGERHRVIVNIAQELLSSHPNRPGGGGHPAQPGAGR